MELGKEVETRKGKGVVRGFVELTDGRYGAIIEHKGKNFLAIEGDDF